jgi:poly(beta-D-mannuronate) lyase
MLNNEWKDVDIRFMANGTPEKPIILRSQTPGKVKLTGSSTIRIGGDYLEVHGLWFDGGDTGKDTVIKFEINSETPANYSRVTNCAITNVNAPARETTSYYISLHGKSNRVDHCSFSGKLNKGPAIAVRLKNSIDNQHLIDHNYFGERLPLGFNGGETIRVGTSTYSKQSSKTIIENNFFEKCNGEMEIISIKSGNNIVRNNLILESEGTITLRHGDYNLVEGNVIIGNNLPDVGGIRMINKGNIVQNNLIIGVKSDGYRAPIVIMNGIPGAKLNEYDQVVDGIIQNNTIINSGPVTFAINNREGATATPVNTKFKNNLFYNDDRNIAVLAVGDISGIEMEGNVVNPSLIADFEGIRSEAIKMEIANGIYIPSLESDKLLSGVTTSPKVRVDASGTLRSNIRAGAIVPGNFKAPLALVSQAGVSFININEMRKMTADLPQVTTTVEPGERTLEKALRNAAGPTTLQLKEGIYTLTKGMKLTSDVTIVGAGRSKTFLKISDQAEKVPQYIFRMEGSSLLKVSGLTIDGAAESEPVKYMVTSPNGETPVTYSLFFDQIDLLNFTNKDGGAIFKAYKGTKADTISFNNSRIKNAYRGLNLTYEKDDNGKYSAEHIILSNTSFADVEEFAINFYRNGEEEGTSGGNLLIDHCVFYRVDDMAKGRIIEVKGIGNVHIKNTVIDNSRATTNIVHLKGANQKVENSVVYNSGKIKLTGGAQEINLDRFNPRWEETDFFTVKDNSDLSNKGTDNKNIGIIIEDLKK